MSSQSNWPPDYKYEFERRIKLISRCHSDSSAQTALMMHYANNPVDWINDWCVTYNPRVQHPLPKTMPFILFPRQVDFIKLLQSCIADKESALVEKARDIGATWICCAFSAWLWIYTPGASVGWGSRKETLVDRIGDPDSIFQKIRMILNALPAWMLPTGFKFTEDATYMKIVNRQNGSTITGESGDAIGRGGRSMIYFKDESAHYERPELIEASLGDNTDVQIDISSVHGTANVFYRRRMAGEIWTPDGVPTKGKTRIFVFDWRDHPGKTQEWYDTRRKKAEDEGLLHLFAQEVDRDYASAIDRVIIPAAWVKAAIDAHIKLGFGEDGKKMAALDVADEGGDKNAYASRHGVILKSADHWGQGDTGETARKAVNMARMEGCVELFYDCIGVGAGVKAETNRLKNEGLIPDTLQVMPWNASKSPDRAEERIIPDDVETPKNGDIFLNLKSQSYWNLRLRFERTYRAVTQGVKYDTAELISLPSTLARLHEIELELSQPVQKMNGAGKMLVDKKPDGAKSPNLADAVVMCYNPSYDYDSGFGFLAFLGDEHRKRQEDEAAKPKFTNTRQ